MEYWNPAEHPDNARKLRLFYGLLSACLMIVVLAKNSITFLMGWEGMAMSAFFLVGTEDERSEVREAAWIYLAASHASTLALFTMFGLMYGATGNYDLSPFTSSQFPPVYASAVFLLALAGFGLKAGLMPLHFWLPSAHAMAPSHVSAMMSGVLIKMGVYGLVRVTGLLPDPPLWWGSLLLILGTLSAIVGMLFALSQHDLKRLLAYSSIENIGIMAIGLGLALLGRTYQSPLWVVLGLSGTLLHVWNHSLFKSLLFMGAGTVIHATHLRQMDSLGGLAKRMPLTAAFFFIGAIAACALPPCNAFISEFLIYLGLFHTLGLPKEVALPAVAFVIPAMALSGAFAIACFTKAYGIVFLGSPRQPLPREPHDPHWPMRLPLGILATLVVCLGVVPSAIAPSLNGICAAWSGLIWDADVAAKAARSTGAARLDIGRVGHCDTGRRVRLVVLANFSIPLLRIRDVGLRIFGTDPATAVHGNVAVAIPGQHVRMVDPADRNPAKNSRTVPDLCRLLEQSARDRPGSRGVSAVRFTGPSNVVVPSVPAGKRSDLFALYRRDAGRAVQRVLIR